MPQLIRNPISTFGQNGLVSPIRLHNLIDLTEIGPESVSGQAAIPTSGITATDSIVVLDSTTQELAKTKVESLFKEVSGGVIYGSNQLLGSGMPNNLTINASNLICPVFEGNGPMDNALATETFNPNYINLTAGGASGSNFVTLSAYGLSGPEQDAKTNWQGTFNAKGEVYVSGLLEAYPKVMDGTTQTEPAKLIINGTTEFNGSVYYGKDDYLGPAKRLFSEETTNHTTSGTAGIADGFLWLRSLEVWYRNKVGNSQWEALMARTTAGTVSFYGTKPSTYTVGIHTGVNTPSLSQAKQHKKLHEFEFEVPVGQKWIYEINLPIKHASAHPWHVTFICERQLSNGTWTIDTNLCKWYWVDVSGAYYSGPTWAVDHYDPFNGQVIYSGVGYVYPAIIWTTYYNNYVTNYAKEFTKGTGTGKYRIGIYYGLLTNALKLRPFVPNNPTPFVVETTETIKMVTFQYATNIERNTTPYNPYTTQMFNNHLPKTWFSKSPATNNVVVGAQGWTSKVSKIKI